MIPAFDRLLKNHTRLPLTLSVCIFHKRASKIEQPFTTRSLTFVFEKFVEIRKKVDCAKCETKADGARFEGKISGGTQRGNLRLIDLCQECCIKYGWGDIKLDELLETQLMGNRNW